MAHSQVCLLTLLTLLTQKKFFISMQPSLADPEMKVVIDKGSMEKLCGVLERMKQLDKYLNLEVCFGVLQRWA